MVLNEQAPFLLDTSFIFITSRMWLYDFSWPGVRPYPTMQRRGHENWLLSKIQFQTEPVIYEALTSKLLHENPFEVLGLLHDFSRMTGLWILKLDLLPPRWASSDGKIAISQALNCFPIPLLLLSFHLG